MSTYSAAARKRIREDIREVHEDEDLARCGIHVDQSEEVVGVLYVLIRGPEDTPYARGLFFFDLVFPFDYPSNPPQMHIVTTDGGRVRFGPNLYSCGKVCLSLLGTWAGPKWTSSHTLSSLLLAVQSLMSAKPFYNEPGTGVPPAGADPISDEYDRVVEHDTLRVSVVGNLKTILGARLEGKQPPPHFTPRLCDRFLEHVQRDNWSSLITRYGQDGLKTNTAPFTYRKLDGELSDLKKRIPLIAEAASSVKAAAGAPMEVVDAPVVRPCDSLTCPICRSYVLLSSLLSPLSSLLSPLLSLLLARSNPHLISIPNPNPNPNPNPLS